MQNNTEETKSIESQEIILIKIKKFEPIIKKYSRKLNYDGAETDLIITLMKILNKLPNNKNEKIITSYIAKSIKNEYIKLSKKNQLITQNEIFFEIEPVGDSNLDMETIIDIKNALKILTTNQRRVIKLKMYYGYSDAEIAAKLNITRQAVNKTKKAALKKIRAYLEKTDK